MVLGLSQPEASCLVFKRSGHLLNRNVDYPVVPWIPGAFPLTIHLTPRRHAMSVECSIPIGARLVRVSSMLCIVA